MTQDPNPTMIGKRFGQLTVLKLLPQRSHKGERIYQCRCNCGNLHSVRGSNFRSGRIKSCGHHPRTHNRLPAHNMIGKQFGQLTVLCLSPQRSHKGELTYQCKCSCGNLHSATGCSLRSGSTKTCGYCPLPPRPPTLAQRFPKEHETWRNMKKRCYQKNRPKYQIYGARGIAVCTSWLNSFTAFLADMGPKPLAHSIERINNNGPYHPSNCRWATPLEQAYNRRTNITLEYNGERKILAEWARLFGLNRNTFRSRLKKGWPIARALHLPTNTKLPHILHNFGIGSPASNLPVIPPQTSSTEFAQFRVVGW